MKRKKAEPIDNILARYLRHIGLETPLNQYRLIISCWRKRSEKDKRYLHQESDALC